MSLISPNADAQKSKKELENDLKRVATLLQNDSLRTKAPFLEHDMVASTYMDQILSLTPEQYSADMEQAQKHFEEIEWMYELGLLEDKKGRYFLTKYFKDFSPADLVFLMERSREERRRLDVVKDYCDNMMARKAEAATHTMPKGKLLKLSYDERATYISLLSEYEVVADSAGHYQLLAPIRFNDEDKVAISLPDDFGEQVRSLLEEKGVYRCLTYYPEPPTMPGEPQLLGGPPSWSFSAEFEDGVVQTGSSRSYPFEAISTINEQMRVLIEAEMQRRSEN